MRHLRLAARKAASPFLAAFLFLLLSPFTAQAVSLGELKWIGNVSVQGIIGRIVRVFFGVSGTIALVMFVYAGFTWMSAAGNEEKIKKAKSTLVWTTLGLIAMFVAYGITNFIIYYIGQSTE